MQIAVDSGSDARYLFGSLVAALFHDDPAPMFTATERVRMWIEYDATGGDKGKFNLDQVAWFHIHDSAEKASIQFSERGVVRVTSKPRYGDLRDIVTNYGWLSFRDNQNRNGYFNLSVAHYFFRDGADDCQIGFDHGVVLFVKADATFNDVKAKAQEEGGWIFGDHGNRRDLAIRKKRVLFAHPDGSSNVRIHFGEGYNVLMNKQQWPSNQL